MWMKDMERKKSYLGREATQWAAVRIQRSDRMAPPQKWEPLFCRETWENSRTSLPFQLASKGDGNLILPDPESTYQPWVRSVGGFSSSNHPQGVDQPALHLGRSTLTNWQTGKNASLNIQPPVKGSKESCLLLTRLSSAEVCVYPKPEGHQGSKHLHD